MKKKKPHDLLNYSDLNKMAGRHSTDPQMDSPGDSSQFASEEVDLGMTYDSEEDEEEKDIPLMDLSHDDEDAVEEDSEIPEEVRVESSKDPSEELQSEKDR